MSNQAYFNGNFYQAVAATTPGQTPASNPALWRKVQIPKKWRFALARLTYANMLEIDGQLDKAMAVREAALTTERVGLDDLARVEENSERWRSRWSVRTPTNHG